MKSIVLTALLAGLALGTPCFAGDLATLMPPDSNVTIIVEVGRILDSPIVKNHVPEFVEKYGYKAMVDAEDDKDDKEELEENAEMIKSVLEDHEDVLKLLSATATTASRLVMAGSVNDKKPEFIALEGKWGREFAESMFTLVALFAPDNISVEKENGRKIFSVDGDEEDKQLYLAIPEDDIIVMSYDTDKIHAIFDRAAAKKPVVSPALASFLKNLGTEDVAHVFIDQADAGMKMTSSIKLKKDAEAELIVDAGEEAKAEAIQNDLDAKLKEFRTGLEGQGGNPMLKIAVDVMNSISAKRDGATLKYHAKLASSDIDALLKLVEEAGK